MKIIFIAIALLISITSASAQTNAPLPSFEEQKAGICSVWVKNAMYGATQKLRGAARETKFITLEILIEMIEHRLGADALYFIEEGYPPHERLWLVTSTLFGYDWMNRWLANNSGAPLPDPLLVQKAFGEVCLNAPQFYEPLIGVAPALKND